jgi:hypothetical protein
MRDGRAKLPAKAFQDTLMLGIDMRNTGFSGTHTLYCDSTRSEGSQGDPTLSNINDRRLPWSLAITAIRDVEGAIQ